MQYKLTKRGFRDLNHPIESERQKLKTKVVAKTNGFCAYCGVDLGSTEIGATIDHVQPRCLGGTDDLDNLLPACSKCNGEKKHMTLDEYRKLKSPKLTDTIIFYFETEVGKGNCFMCEGKINEDNSCDCTPASQ